MKWVEGFADWFERAPAWASVLLFPVVAPLMLGYGVVALAAFLVFVLPYFLIVGDKRVQSPAATFTRDEVRELAESLSGWFADTLAGDTEANRYLGVGPELAQQLARLAGKAGLTSDEAALFAERVGQALKGYKGTPFFALKHLSRRLAELAKLETGV